VNPVTKIEIPFKTDRTEKRNQKLKNLAVDGDANECETTIFVLTFPRQREGFKRPRGGFTPSF